MYLGSQRYKPTSAEQIIKTHSSESRGQENPTESLFTRNKATKHEETELTFLWIQPEILLSDNNQ